MMFIYSDGTTMRHTNPDDLAHEDKSHASYRSLKRDVCSLPVVPLLTRPKDFTLWKILGLLPLGGSVGSLQGGWSHSTLV